MRLVVTGGRDFRDKEYVYECLDRIHRDRPITTLIQGGATGADSLAYQWAISKNILSISEPIYYADSVRYGGRAGPRRNQRMLDLHYPDAIAIFPGGNGTRDMISRCKHLITYDFWKDYYVQSS